MGIFASAFSWFARNKWSKGKFRSKIIRRLCSIRFDDSFPSDDESQGRHWLSVYEVFRLHDNKCRDVCEKCVRQYCNKLQYTVQYDSGNRADWSRSAIEAALVTFLFRQVAIHERGTLEHYHDSSSKHTTSRIKGSTRSTAPSSLLLFRVQCTELLRSTLVVVCIVDYVTLIGRFRLVSGAEWND